MLYLIAIVLSLLGGFACGFLFYRNNAKKSQSIESEGKKLLDALKDRKSTRLNSSHSQQSRMPSSA